MMHRTRPWSRVPPVSTKYYPAVCPDGHRPFVVKAEGAVTGAIECPECGKRAQLIPGAYYSEQFLATLCRVIEEIWAAELTSLRAQVALQELDRVANEPTRARLREVLSQLGGLESLAALIPNVTDPDDSHELRCFVGLLMSLLAAYAGGHGASSTVPGMRISLRESGKFRHS